MPPLSLTQSKYAFAVFGMSVKSVPGCLVAMPPSLIGVPVAFWPLPSPHLDAEAAGAAALVLALDELELLLSLPPQAATTERAAAIRAATTTGRIRRDPRSMRITPPPLGVISLAPPGACDELRRQRVGDRQPERRPGRCVYVISPRQPAVLERRAERDRCERRADPFDRRVEEVERREAGLGGDLR